jgi:hypothetical protein
VTRAQFEKLQLKSLVILSNGVESRVEAIDEDDQQIMDECGGWHDYANVEAPTYEA